MSKKEDYNNNQNKKHVPETVKLRNMQPRQNSMNDAEYKKMMNKLANHYEDKKKEIDELVKYIGKEILFCDPLDFLNYLITQDFLSSLENLEQYSELYYSENQLFISLSIEYTHSILVSNKQLVNQQNDLNEDNTEKYSMLQKKS